MMAKFLLCFLLLTVSFPDAGTILLNRITLYRTESYYKDKVYTEKTWEAFYRLPEAQHTLDPQHYDFHLLNAAFFFATNKLRESHGLKPFIFSAGLRDAATVHTDQMIQNNFFSHYNNRGSRKIATPEQRMKLFIQDPHFSGENCDENFVEPYEQLSYIGVAERVLQDLYDSPSHRDNILQKGFHYSGCAILFEAARGKNEAIYLKATQDFASNI